VRACHFVDARIISTNNSMHIMLADRCRQRPWPGKPTEASCIHGTTRRSPRIRPLHRSDRTVSIGVFPAYSANGTCSTIVYNCVAEQPHAGTTQRNANPTQRNALHTGTRACRSVLEEQIIRLMESISEQLAYESMPAEVGHAAALAHPVEEHRHEESGCAALHCRLQACLW
jgi:hypothetical protein